jgi:hypothetical protein
MSGLETLWIIVLSHRSICCLLKFNIFYFILLGIT